MNKLYNKQTWHNDTTPAINEDNLNHMEDGIDAIDSRLVEISGTLMDTIPEILEMYDDIETLTKNPPYIGINGNWYVWDTETGAYVDSGVDASITVTIADVTMLPTGSQPYVTNTGTNTDPIFHLFIPYGGSIIGVTGVKGDAESTYRSGDVNLTKANIGLGNVDNTSDLNKPISTATQTALDGKVPNTRTVNGHALSSDVSVTASDVGLGNVPNVTTDNQTPTVTQASARANIATGDTLKTIIGKIKKFFADLGDLAFLNKDSSTGANNKFLKGDGTWDYVSLLPFEAEVHNRNAFITSDDLGVDSEAALTVTGMSGFIPIMYFDKADQQDTFILIQLGFYADDKWLGSGILTITGTRYENPTYQRPNKYNIKFEGGGIFGSDNPFSSIVVGEREQGTNAIMLFVRQSNTNKKLHYRVFHNYGIESIEYVTSPVAYTQSQIYHMDDAVSIQSGMSCNNSAEFEGDLTVGNSFIVDVSADEVSGDAVDTTPTSGSKHIVTSGGVYAALSGKANTSDLGTAAAKDYATSVTQNSGDLVTSGAVWTAIDNLPEPMIFKGSLGTGGTITSLPTASSANTGFTYKVITDGTYASQAAKVGDVFVSNGSAWVLIPAGDESSADTWRNIKVNGTEAIGSGISTGAVNFKSGTNATVSANGNDITISATDTTYSAATTSADGLMSSTDKTKLNGIATGAEVNQNAFANVKVGSSTVAADSKTDTLELVAGSNVTLTPDTTNDKVTIAATDTTYSNATTSAAGLMSSTDKTKLNGIATGAEVNQNAFANVKVGSTTVAADAKQDTLELVAGSNVTLTPDATNDKVTIAATDTTYESKAAATGGTDLSLVTTGEKYTWGQKQSALSTMSSSELTTGTATTARSVRADYLKSGVNSLIDTKINGLDGGTIGTPSASKTLTALSETNGNISATFGNIAIAESQVTNLTTDLAAKLPLTGGTVTGDITLGGTSENPACIFAAYSDSQIGDATHPIGAGYFDRIITADTITADGTISTSMDLDVGFDATIGGNLEVGGDLSTGNIDNSDHVVTIAGVTIEKDTSDNETAVTADNLIGNLIGDVTGNASSADKIGTSTVGSATQPVYINGGVPMAAGHLMTQTSTTVASSGWTAESYTSPTGTVYGYKKEVSITGMTASSYIDGDISSGTYTGAYAFESASGKATIRTATQPASSLTFRLYYQI